MDVLADFPLRLERNRTGIYYWPLARDGEYHWWLMVVGSVECTGGSKSSILAPAGPGTQMDAIRTYSFRIIDFPRPAGGGAGGIGRVGRPPALAKMGAPFEGSEGRIDCI
jgi:hypothetical protein